MRISGGTAKGRATATKRILKHKAGTDDRLRPTSAKVREALFDILGSKIKGAVFVDLYAGTGTVGLEALSRGAEKVIFVETENIRVKLIQRLVNELKFQDNSLVIRGNAREFVLKAAGQNNRHDIFFIDPPYNSDELEDILHLMGDKDILNNSGVLVAEHFFKKNLPDTAGLLEKKKVYRYGDTMLTVYRKENL